MLFLDLTISKKPEFDPSVALKLIDSKIFPMHGMAKSFPRTCITKPFDNSESPVLNSIEKNSFSKSPQDGFVKSTVGSVALILSINSLLLPIGLGSKSSGI